MHVRVEGRGQHGCVEPLAQSGVSSHHACRKAGFLCGHALGQQTHLLVNVGQSDLVWVLRGILLGALLLRVGLVGAARGFALAVFVASHLQKRNGCCVPSCFRFRQQKKKTMAGTPPALLGLVACDNGVGWDDPYAPQYPMMDPYAQLVCLEAKLRDVAVVPWLHPWLASTTGLPDHTIGSISFFLVALIGETLAFYLTHALFNLVWPSFAAISPAHKKWYVVANFWKAGLLGLMSLSFPYWLYTYFQAVQDNFHTHAHHQQLTKFTVINYAVTDLVALYMVPKLPRSTVIHHWVSSAFLVLTCASPDIQQYDTLKMVILYGTFSTVAYTTNFYLTLRVMYQERWWMRPLAIFSFIVYLLACAGNWTWHTLWFLNGLYTSSISLWGILYYFGLAFIVQDDVKLMQWLLDRALNRPIDAKDKKDAQEKDAGDKKKE
eukprot:m.85679 g.85679  ORF g.85679 m.85679 type:complete len:435 (-) comp17896_c0_seq1:34-1338(-)